MFKKNICLICLVLLLTACKSNASSIDINKTKNIQFHELSFTIQEDFEKVEDSTENTEYYDLDFYQYKEPRQLLCDIVFYYNGYTMASTDQTFSLLMPEKYYEPFNIQTKNINGIDWRYAETKSIKENGSSRGAGAYIANYNNNKYIITYTDYKEEIPTCKNIINNTINSLKFSS